MGQMGQMGHSKARPLPLPEQNANAKPFAKLAAKPTATLSAVAELRYTWPQLKESALKPN
jgi:hypothetical protein